jgi:microcystin-dependent protein
MIRLREWKVSPSLISGSGVSTNIIKISGKLFLNDNNDVLINDPLQDNILVFKETGFGDNGQAYQWENQDLTSTITPIVQDIIDNQPVGSNPALICDEIRMYGGDVNANFHSTTGASTGVDPTLDNWFLCNGLNGTQNLESRFVFGYDRATSAHNPVGWTDGEDRVTLSIAESGVGLHDHGATGLTIASSGVHTHTWTASTPYKAEGESKSGSGSHCAANNSRTDIASSGAHTHTVSGTTADTSAPASQSHNNMPPYIVLAFIQYKGCSSLP